MKQLIFIIVLVLVSCSKPKRDLSRNEILSIIEARVDSLNIKGITGDKAQQKLVDSLLLLDPNNKTGKHYKGLFLFFNGSSKKAIPFLKNSLNDDSSSVSLNLLVGMCFEDLKFYDSADFYFEKVMNGIGEYGPQNAAFSPHLTSVLFGKDEGIRYIEQNKNKMIGNEYLLLKNNLKDFEDNSRFSHFYPSFYYRNGMKMKYELTLDSLSSNEIGINSMSELSSYLIENGINVDVTSVSHNLDSDKKIYHIETNNRFANYLDKLELEGLKKL